MNKFGVLVLLLVSASSVLSSPEEVNHLMLLKEKNPDLKILVRMGGWNEASITYSQVAADPEKRATMVQSVLDYLHKWGFDGFELAWEYPGLRGGDPKKDPINFVVLLNELKVALSGEGLILSAAVSADPNSIDISYPDVKAVSDNLDQINVNTYETYPKPGGLWPPDETPQPELNSIVAVKQWLDKGADPAKLNLGVDTFGRNFTADIVNGTLGYNRICQLGPEWKYVWDDEQRVPIRVKDDEWIVYEDVNSLGIKADFAKELNLGGVSVWSLDLDDFLGLCGDAYPLVNSIKGHLKH